MKKLKIGIASIVCGLFLAGLLMVNVSLKSGEDKTSIVIAKNIAAAEQVWGCCKEDPGDTCNAYGATIEDCDECFVFANCNKPDPPPRP